MKCPFCNNDMKKGGVKILDVTFNTINNVIWYPEEELNKKIKRNYVSLGFNAEGYYCEECMKVVAIFNEK